MLECSGAEQVEEPDQPGELQMLAKSIRYLPWTLDNTPNLLTGQFWTLTSPDKKWKLRCVPCTYETNVGSITVYGDTVNADVLITDEYAYSYYNGKEWQRDWAEKGTPIIQGSGTLTLPKNAVDSNNIYYVIGVGEWAFEDYSSTVRPKLVIPYDWTAPFGVGNNAFTEYEVEADNLNYYSADGVLFAKGGADGDTLMQIPASRKGTYEIPAAVARVREAAVEDVRLTELKIGPTLKEFESGHVNDYINKVTITDNDRFSCENGLLLGNNGEDLVLVLWGVVKGKDVVVPSTVTTIDASCADGLPVSSFVFTSDTLTVEDGAFEETETKVLDFSGVGHLSIGPNMECLNATTTIKFPEDTTFTAGWLQICSEDNRLMDIYWETSEAQADSGLHYLQVGNGDYDFDKPGAVRLHVMNDAGDWPEVLGNVPVVKDLYVATLDFADGVQEEERIRKAGEAIGTLPTPVLDGHVFKGWFTEADGGAKVTATTKVTGTVTYYAHWAAAVTTAVMAECDGMGSTTGGGETEIGKKAIVKATAKSGKVFAGWYMSDNTTEPAPGEYRAESYGFVSDGKPATLYARFVDKADDTLTLDGSDTTEQAVAEVDGSWTLDLGAQIDSLSLPTVTVEGLPKGMTFNAETLTISGTATEPKEYTLKVTVKNKSGNTEKKTIELTVKNLRPDGFDEWWFRDEYELYGGVFDEDELTALTEGLTDLAEEGWTITASGLPAGLTYKAATATTDATFTGTATTEKEYTVYFTASRGTGNNAETRRASTTMIVEFAELTVEPNDPDCGTATGGGRYAANRKVGLRATAKTGYVFVGWFRGNEPMDAEELGADYRTASVTYVTTSDDEEITANFLPKDWIAAPVITVDGDVYELPDDGEFELDLGLAVESLTVPKITVTGLPKGLKFDAKTNLITGNATEPGNKPVTVKASNESGTTTGEFTLQVPQLKSEVGYIGNLQEGYTLEGGVPDEDTFNEYSTLASAFTQSGWSVTVTGLPKGLKYNSKTGAITGIAEAEGEYTVYIVSKQGAVTETATTVFTVVFPQLTVESADTTKGTVKNVSGGYKAGTKVTLKATPAEGCVFGGWYKVEGTEETPLEADADYRNESLTYTTTTANATIKAKFAEAADDAITINVAAEYTTGDDGTFELDLSQLVESITVPKIAVTGLPKGLKFDAKTNKISGQATTPGVDPYEVKIMATNKSETKTATFKLKVKNFRSEMFDAAWLGDEYEAIAGVMKGTTDLLGGLGSLISSGWKVSVSGLPSGIVYKAPTSTYEGEFAGTATTEGYYTLYITASKSGAATQTATTTVVVDFPMLEVTSENETKGTVTGGGKYPAGKKVTLKAKANKGYVFAGWYMAGAELEGEYRAESYTYVTGETAASIEGRFVTEEEDEEEIALVFDPAELYPAQDEIEDIQVAVVSHSIPSVKVEGLPKGLKFDAKTLKITGTPTQPGEEATVKFTVTNKSNKQGMTFWRTMKIGDAESGELPNLWYNTKPGVDGYALLVPGEAVDEDLLFMGEDLIGWTITGLPAGVKFDSKTGKFSGSATKSGEKCTLTIKKGSETATVALWTKPYPELKLGKYLMDRGDYDDDTMFKADDLFVVTGAGNYKVNTQVTVTATAPKKWVFIGWATPTEKDATTFTLTPESYDAKYTFKMPNPGDNTDTVKLVAVFTHVLGEGDVDKAEIVGFDEE